MANEVSEVDINKISSLAYVGVADNPKSDIYTEYKMNNEEIDVGTIIDYYLGQGEYEGDTEGKQILEDRFDSKIGGELEYDLWIKYLNELNENPECRSWKISNIKLENGADGQSDSGTLTKDGYIKDCGFAACVVETSPGVAVVAFRGSEPLGKPQYINDWHNNSQTAYMEENAQEKAAKKYITDLEGKLEHIGKLYITGHSLGGHLALYASFNIPPGLEEKLVSATTFAAPGFNKETIDRYQDVIDRLIAEGKMKEYQNYLDPVGSLLYNPTTPIYLQSNNPSADPFSNHSNFLLQLNQDGSGFEEVEEKSMLCRFIHDMTIGFEALPNFLKEGLVETVFSIWNGKIDVVDVVTGVLAAGIVMVGVLAIGPLFFIVGTIAAIIEVAAVLLVIGNLTKLWQMLEERFETIKNAVEDYLNQKVNELLEFFSSIPDTCGKALAAIGDWVKKQFKKAIEDTITITMIIFNSIKAIRKIQKKIQKVKPIEAAGMAIVIGSGLMLVELERLKDLGKKVDDFKGSHKNNMKNIVSSTRSINNRMASKYNEYYVQQTARKIEARCSEIEKRMKEVEEILEGLVSGVKNAGKAYASLEAEICKQLI